MYKFFMCTGKETKGSLNEKTGKESYENAKTGGRYDSH